MACKAAITAHWDWIGLNDDHNMHADNSAAKALGCTGSSYASQTPCPLNKRERVDVDPYACCVTGSKPEGLVAPPGQRTSIP